MLNKYCIITGRSSCEVKCTIKLLWTLFILVTMCMLSCRNVSPVETTGTISAFNQLALLNDQDEQVDFSVIGTKRAALFFFLSPECPLCRTYAKDFRQYASLQDSLDIKSYGVFSGTYYSKKQIGDYRARYGLTMEFVMDPDYVLSEYLGASITPESFLIDSLGQILYYGAIDNWAYEVGRTRQKPTENYLDDAILNLLEGRNQNIKHKEAIGCFIE